MRDIKFLRRKWYWDAKDKLDASKILCRSFDGSCTFTDKKHDANCSILRAMRENEKWKDYGREPVNETHRADSPPQETSVRNFAEGYSNPERD